MRKCLLAVIRGVKGQPRVVRCKRCWRSYATPMAGIAHLLADHRLTSYATLADELAIERPPVAMPTG